MSSRIAHASLERPLHAARPVGAVLTNLSAGLCALTIVVYQAWFMPYFLPFFTGRDKFAGVVFYPFYGSLLIVSLVVLAARHNVRNAVVLFAIAAAMAIAPVALHPVGMVTKSYVITLFLGGAAIVLMLASTPAIVLRLTASVTALNAVVCILDLFFANGFTNSLGRAAGLAINPNVAAAGLLLGAAASHRAVSNTWRASFFVLVGAALLVTLSRSTLIFAFAAVAAPLAIRIGQRYRNGRRFQIDFTGWPRALALACVLLGAIGAAFTVNAYFRVAINDSLGGVLYLSKALDEAKEAVETSAERVAPGDPAGLRDVTSPSSATSAGSALPDAPPPAGKGAPTTSDAKIQALGERLSDEGKRNSISARALFLERGLLAFREGGFFGRGLEEAQALAPHNTFVLFAIAFGYLGWLIPIGVVGFAFCFVRDARDLPLGIAVLGVMLTSHDLMLNPSLFLPVANGIGGMLVARMAPAQNGSAPRSFAVGTIGGVALFGAGYVAILLLAPSFAVERLAAGAMFATRGGYGILLSPPQYPGLFQFDERPAAPPAPSPALGEEGTALRHVAWSPQAWPAVRQGEYTFRHQDTVLFAATDASDPRRNGRSYVIAVPLSVSTLCFIFFGTIILWAMATVVTFHRSRPPRQPVLDA